MTDSDLVVRPRVPAPTRHALALPARRAVAAGLVAVFAGSLVTCSSGDDDSAGAAGGPAAGSAGESTATEEVPAGPFAVGRRDLTLVDASRGTDAVPGKLPAEPDRTLEVRVMYPTDGDPGPEPPLTSPPEGAATLDAEPLDGEFPLVVIAHGFNGQGEFFQGWAERLAREGYVVAAPTFPLSKLGVAVFDDVQQQPGDVSFVLYELSDLGADDPLAGHVDVERIAVAGHSLGAATTMGVAYNSCCVDARIDAAIPVAGGPLPFDGGDYEDMPPTPMLVAHGEGDEIAPIAASDVLLEMATGPTWYLRTVEADHVSVLFGEHGELLADAVLAFLDAHLQDDDRALDAMGETVEASGLGEWRTVGTG